jgi:archaellum biogenesis ATPase FlaH
MYIDRLKYKDNNGNDVAEISPTFTTSVYNARSRGRCKVLMIGGDFGKGKTTCAMQLAYDILARFHPEKTEEELWRMVLESIVFTRKQLKESLTRASREINWNELEPREALKKSKEIRKDVILWDDASIHGSKHRRNERIAYEIQSNFHQIRDATCCMIITLPESDDLLKSIREYRGLLLGEIDTQKDNNYNKIIIYRRKVRAGRKSPWKGFIYSHMFPVRIDNNIYGDYVKLRNIAKIENIIEEEKKEKFLETEMLYMEARRKYLLKKMDSLNAKNFETPDIDS